MSKVALLSVVHDERLVTLDYDLVLDAGIEEGLIATQVVLDHPNFVRRVLRQLQPDFILVELWMDKIPANKVGVPFDDMDLVALSELVHLVLFDFGDQLLQVCFFKLDTKLLEVFSDLIKPSILYRQMPSAHPLSQLELFQGDWRWNR